VLLTCYVGREHIEQILSSNTSTHLSGYQPATHVQITRPTAQREAMNRKARQTSSTGIPIWQTHSTQLTSASGPGVAYTGARTIRVAQPHQPQSQPMFSPEPRARYQPASARSKADIEELDRLSKPETGQGQEYAIQATSPMSKLQQKSANLPSFAGNSESRTTSLGGPTSIPTHVPTTTHTSAGSFHTINKSMEVEVDLWRGMIKSINKGPQRPATAS
jgi:hypothetical protein